MGKVYTICGDEVKGIVKKLVTKYYPEIREGEVSIECIFADAGKDDQEQWKPAVKLHGLPCAAVIKKTSVEQRTQGMSDATIIIDEHVWEKLTEPERLALIDHELYHVDPQRDEGGAIRTDEAGRPVIKLKHHDWELAGFAAISKRHEDAALEVQQMVQFSESSTGQMVFGFKNRG